jgi:DNA-directed RNA polymerase subunit K/omega
MVCRDAELAAVVSQRTFRTTDYLTKFELARVVGLRVLQLMDENTVRENPCDVATREILSGTTRAIVRRRLPDGTVEDRAVRDLYLTGDMRRMCSTPGLFK